uniref:Transposase IS605 OrfB C-terminal domain-containing protein n=1 Tax=Sulfoacidibacillus thermotolerans TaxID=1765684 RepID=UPI002888F891|nr:Chain A, Transposase IS605 OrfB C-terminal domain-containing protein [Sulfoacidibacillus thermotolerans]8J3R_B Chain B, Transposase IS605 OrfB C-terminal domain-containing protein [Sulfoacidibacillus thermotolerans]
MGHHHHHHGSMIKVYRYEIVKPLDLDWKEFGTILRQLQQETRFALNKATQLAWEWMGFSSDYKDNHGEYPKSKDILGYTNVHGYAYHTIKTKAYRLNSGNLSQTIKRATDRFKAYQKEILRGDMSIPSYKRDHPLDLIKENISVNRMNHGDYIASLSLLSNPAKQEMNVKRKISVIIIVRGAGKTIMDRILSGEYQVSASQIIHKDRKNKWYLNISYRFEPQTRVLDLNKIMGIDLGVAVAAYMAFQHTPARYKLEGGEIENFRRQVESRRISMLRQGKYAGGARGGHGRDKRIKPIEQLRDKIANFRDTTNHRYSRYIVDMAIKEGCGTIQMEDLTNIRDIGSRFLQNWTYYDLQQKIIYKAEEAGIKVIKIDPQYTSQRCSECGNIDSGNRIGQAIFKCRACGYEANADYNAARNIAIPNIDKIIAESIK